MQIGFILWFTNINIIYLFLLYTYKICQNIYYIQLRLRKN